MKVSLCESLNFHIHAANTLINFLVHVSRFTFAHLAAGMTEGTVLLPNHLKTGFFLWKHSILFLPCLCSCQKGRPIIQNIYGNFKSFFIFSFFFEKYCICISLHDQIASVLGTHPLFTSIFSLFWKFLVMLALCLCSISICVLRALPDVALSHFWVDNFWYLVRFLLWERVHCVSHFS